MANAFDKGAVWSKFRLLEGEFVNAIQFFPFEKKHSNLWSEFFSDLLVKTGNSVDSVFRLMMKDRAFESYSHVAGLEASKKRRDIDFFRQFFEPIYELSSADVRISYKSSVYQAHSFPFRKFRNGKNPEWWKAYNHVKHEWFERMKEATLEHTIEALAGLFLLNILYSRNQVFIVRHTNVFFAEYMRKADIERYLGESMKGVPKSLSHWPITAETPLFTHVLRVDESAEGSPLKLSDDGASEE